MILALRNGFDICFLRCMNLGAKVGKYRTIEAKTGLKGVLFERGPRVKKRERSEEG